MNTTIIRQFLVFNFTLGIAGFSAAEPITYNIDSSHTYPSFEADHFHGLSIWRGKVNSTSGTIVMDREAQTGSVDVTMDMSTIDFGHERMNSTATGDILEVEIYPTANYQGTLKDFIDNEPTAVEGMLTMHGFTLPLNLQINRFQCQPHHRSGIELCGADASATFDRSDYGLDADLELGFFPEVRLLISVEARASQEN